MIPLLLAVAAPLTGCPAVPGWTYAAPAAGTEGLLNVLRYERGDLTFNHVPVSDDVLRQYIGRAMTIEPTPMLLVDKTTIDCAILQRVQRIIARIGGCAEYVCYAYNVPHVAPPPAPPRSSKRRH